MGLGIIKKGWAIISTPPRKREKVDTKLGIISNGEDNAYPSRMERIINNSISAKTCANMYARFLVGDGFEDESLNDIVLSIDRTTNKKITALSTLRHIAREFSKHSGAWLHIKKNGELFNTEIKIVPSTQARFGKPDDVDYKGKVVVYDNWEREDKFDKSKIKSFNLYDERESVIKYQITGKTNPTNAEIIEGIKRWPGQIYFQFLDDEFIYPLSPIDAVQHDADSEMQVSLFRNGELRRGFYCKHIIAYDEIEDEEEREKFEEDLKSFEGATEGGSYLAVEGIARGDNGEPRMPILVQKIEQNINDNLFENYIKGFSNNIRKAYNNIPPVLVDYQEGKLGNTSGEEFIQAVSFYNDQTEVDRKKIEQIFSELMKYWHDASLREKDWTIKKLGKDGDNTTLDNNTTTDNQTDLAE